MEVGFVRDGMCRMHGVMRRLAAGLLALLVLAGVVWAEGSLVVITAKGKKYHRPDCRTVKQVMRTLTAEESQKLGYTPCKVCRP